VALFHNFTLHPIFYSPHISQLYFASRARGARAASSQITMVLSIPLIAHRLVRDIIAIASLMRTIISILQPTVPEERELLELNPYRRGVERCVRLVRRPPARVGSCQPHLAFRVQGGPRNLGLSERDNDAPSSSKV